MLKKILLWLLAIPVLLIAFVMWAKVPEPTPENTVEIEFDFVQVQSPCCQDVMISVPDDDHVYYINRGLEKGIVLDERNQKFQGKKMTLSWVKTRWNPFNSSGRHRPVAKVSSGGEVYFDLAKDWSKE